MEKEIKKYSIWNMLEATIYSDSEENPETLRCDACKKVMARDGKPVHGRKYFWFDSKHYWCLCSKNC